MYNYSISFFGKYFDWGSIMNLAKMSPGGQITLPIEVRRQLKIKAGDTLIFLQRENGDVIVSNAALKAIDEAHKAVSGSEYSEDEILADLMELRYGSNKVITVPSM